MISASHSAYMISPCSFSDFRLISNLADVADVFVASSIPQSVANDALEVLIDLSRRNDSFRSCFNGVITSLTGLLYIPIFHCNILVSPN